MLAPMELPSSAVASRAGIDEMAALAPGGAGDGALEPLGRQRIVGVAGEIAGQEFAVLTTTRVWPGLIAPSTFLVPTTTMSPPSTRSAPPAATRMAWISSGVLAMRMWL